jgi:hypothetical protein
MLIQSDFAILHPFRTASAGSADLTLLGYVNLSSTGGLISDATMGSSWRATIPTELLTSVTDTDDYEIFRDNFGTADAVDYHNFVDYHKAYIVNSGDEDLLYPQTSVTGITAVTDTTVTNIYSTYIALGLCDNSDYSERSALATANDYADGTREGFPRITFSNSVDTTGLTDTKVAESIARVGDGSDALVGAHRIIRSIDQDAPLYLNRKYIKIEWTGTVSTPVYVYVIGETNKAGVLGRVLVNGTDSGNEKVLDATDDTSDVTFHKIYGVFCIDQASPINCWNDIVRSKLVGPDQDLTVKYRSSTDADDPANWYTWTEFKTYTTGDRCPISLTFFDERIIYYGTNEYLINNFKATSDYGLQQTRNPTTTYSTKLLEAQGTFTVDGTDSTIAYVDFASDEDTSTISLGDRVLGIHPTSGVCYDLGWVTHVGESPSYSTLTVSLFPSDSANPTYITPATVLTVKVYKGQQSRTALWFRREAACQATNPANSETQFFWKLYGT